jgi:hypothetical protein
MSDDGWRTRLRWVLMAQSTAWWRRRVLADLSGGRPG